MRYFGERLKRAREEMGISQRSLALSLGLSDKTISSYETSNSYPNLEILKKISDFFQKPTDYFLASKYEESTLLERVRELERDTIELKREG